MCVCATHAPQPPNNFTKTFFEKILHKIILLLDRAATFVSVLKRKTFSTLIISFSFKPCVSHQERFQTTTKKTYGRKKGNTHGGSVLHAPPTNTVPPILDISKTNHHQHSAPFKFSATTDTHTVRISNVQRLQKLPTTRAT